MKKLLPFALGAALVVGGGVFLSSTGGSTVSGTTALSPITPALAQDADIELMPDMIMGQVEAPVEIIEYASYTCPHCADFHDRVWEKLKADYIETGKVKFVHREVFFDKYGLWAALIARTGGDMRYFGITDMIYETQRDWIGDGQDATILENLKTIGRKAGLTDEEMETALNNQELAQRLVATYQTKAGADEVTGTPTLVINGEKHSNMTYDELTEIIDGLIEG